MKSECLICTENILPFQLYKFTPCCINIFHSKCLNEWYNHKPICPNCRYNINDIESINSNEPFEDIPPIIIVNPVRNRSTANRGTKSIFYTIAITLPIVCIIGILFLLLFVFLN
jgi:hypothetical protein